MILTIDVEEMPPALAVWESIVVQSATHLHSRGLADPRQERPVKGQRQSCLPAGRSQAIALADSRRWEEALASTSPPPQEPPLARSQGACNLQRPSLGKSTVSCLQSRA